MDVKDLRRLLVMGKVSNAARSEHKSPMTSGLEEITLTPENEGCCLQNHIRSTEAEMGERWGGLGGGGGGGWAGEALFHIFGYCA